ncbi:MAG TPA: galactose oxidase early set domain-containing protein [Acidimicrobiales bacterium]|nr:galactose oxidase early set domain-containing protein [Acidimicrobiales bacterium]
MFGWRTRALAVAGAVITASVPISGSAGAADGDPAQIGRFTPAFEEAGGTCVVDADGRELCKPAAATTVVLSTGRVLYWDALEGTENVNLTVLAEGGHSQGSARTRVLDLSTGSPRFRAPTPEDGGANVTGHGSEYLPFVPHDDPIVNDADLFCADQVQLADGRILSVGGTDWYAEPYYGEYLGHRYGLPELEGLHNARLFDPYTETWTQSGSLEFGRWYPSLVTLPDGKVLAASGVSKLIKPLYPERPFDSGTNVRQLETYDPAAGTWTTQPTSANRSLPLYPRLHLLPNGHVYYDAGGQVFNPMGQSYDEALWNVAATYDPVTARWTDLGVPGLGFGALPGLPDLPGRNGMLGGLPVLPNLPLDGLPNAGGERTGVPGFRGSAFSIMLPLEPEDDGSYRRSEFLSAGGVLGVTPGTYLGTTSSQVNTVTIDEAGVETLSSRPTGDLGAARWYGTGVLLPTGEVMVLNGSSRDEVVLPGLGVPVTTPELFDPTTETWRPMAQQARSRTYHNTAVLLPDGRVLSGGHAPVPTIYGFNVSVPGLSPNEGRDPSFEIFSPPYLFQGDRPTVVDGPSRVDTGTTFDLTLGSPEEAAAVEDEGRIVLMRNTAITHLVDGDQRAVVLPVVSREGATLTVKAPPTPSVAPPGPYLLFVNRQGDDGPIPSVGRQVFVDAPVPADVAALPAGQDGTTSPPVVLRPPQDVFMENLADAFGTEAVASEPTATSRDVREIPGWLVVIAAGLPMAVLTAQPAVCRRRAVQVRDLPG